MIIYSISNGIIFFKIWSFYVTELSALLIINFLNLNILTNSKWSNTGTSTGTGIFIWTGTGNGTGTWVTTGAGTGTATGTGAGTVTGTV